MHVSPFVRFLTRTSLLLCGLLVFGLSSVQAATYYVDQNGLGGSCNSGNPGTITQPVCTIDQGVQKLHSGDTLYIRGGSYLYQNIGIYGPTRVPSGTDWQHPTTVSSYQSEIVWLDQAGIALDGGVQYLLFHGLRVNNGSLYFDETPNHIQFEWGEFTNTGPGDANMFIEGLLGDFRLLHNKIHNAGGGTRGNGCTDVYGCYGMYFRGHDSLFEFNEVYDNAAYGFHIWHSNLSDVINNIVRNNIFYNNGFTDLRGNFGSGFILSCGRDNQAYNNISYNNYGGMEVGNRCDNCLVYNNTVYNNTHHGIALSSSDGIQVINNISYGNGPNGDQDDIPNSTQAPATNVTKRNNHTTNNGDPRFVNAGAGNFALQQNSPARDTGEPLSLVTYDYMLTARPQPTGGAWDRGAYEYIVPSTCPPDCPNTCPPNCPDDENPTSADVYVSPGGHSDTPSDSNGCRTAETITSPKATIASAAACMTIPGKAMVLRGGIFTGTLDTRTTPVKGGTSWAAPTRIKRYAAEVPVLTMPTAATDGVLIFGAPATDSFIEVDGLTIDGASRSSGDGLLVLYSSDLHFKNMTIHHNHYQNIAMVGASNIEILTSALTNPLGFANVALYDTSSNVLISGNTMSSGVLAGVALDASGTSNSVTIAKNTITSTVNGVDVGPGTGVVVVNNVIQSQSTNGIRVRSGAVGTHVYHNDSVSNTGTGILCDSGATGVDIANNIIVANGTQLTNNCTALDRGNLKTGTLAAIFTTVPVLKTTAPVSPAINSGVDLPSVTDDQIGIVRPFAVQWDAGAREAQIAPAPGPTTGVSRIMMMIYF
jgi:parallel beta-helix repeat protein